jgi:hypothetical protein
MTRDGFRRRRLGPRLPIRDRDAAPPVLAVGAGRRLESDDGALVFGRSSPSRLSSSPAGLASPPSMSDG